MRVGHFEGRVAEVTWRATKLRTITGNFVILPNNLVGKEAIINYSEPALPTRLEVEVGVSYLTPPNEVKRVMLEAIANARHALQAPAPVVLLHAFEASAIAYRAQFWIDNYENEEIARSDVRKAIFYAFERHEIEIPWPISVEYSREWPEKDSEAECRKREEVLARVDLFSAMTPEQRRQVAVASRMRRYGDGEKIVQQGQPGESMYVLCTGAAVVALEDPAGGPNRTEVATIKPGGYFGEMSLLTGEPRTATVTAKGDTSVVEIGAPVFRELGDVNPQTVEQIGATAISRRAELEAARAAASGTGVVQAPANLLARMKKFLRLR